MRGRKRPQPETGNFWAIVVLHSACVRDAWLGLDPAQHTQVIVWAVQGMEIYSCSQAQDQWRNKVVASWLGAGDVRRSSR